MKKLIVCFAALSCSAMYAQTQTIGNTTVVTKSSSTNTLSGGVQANSGSLVSSAGGMLIGGGGSGTASAIEEQTKTGFTKDLLVPRLMAVQEGYNIAGNPADLQKRLEPYFGTFFGRLEYKWELGIVPKHLGIYKNRNHWKSSVKKRQSDNALIKEQRAKLSVENNQKFVSSLTPYMNQGASGDNTSYFASGRGAVDIVDGQFKQVLDRVVIRPRIAALNAGKNLSMIPFFASWFKKVSVWWDNKLSPAQLGIFSGRKSWHKHIKKQVQKAVEDERFAASLKGDG